jgi:hypothetical protein
MTTTLSDDTRVSSISLVAKARGPRDVVDSNQLENDDTAVGVYWVDAARRQNKISSDCNEAWSTVPVLGSATRAMRKARRDQVMARLRKSLGKAREGHGQHAPFCVTTRRGHTVQTFQSLELALEAAESFGPDHYVIDRHGLRIWDPQKELLRSEE